VQESNYSDKLILIMYKIYEVQNADNAITFKISRDDKLLEV